MLQKASTISLKSESIPQQGINTNVRMAIAATENWHSEKPESVMSRYSQDNAPDP